MQQGSQPFQLITSTQIISCSWVVQGMADKWGGGKGGSFPQWLGCLLLSRQKWGVWEVSLGIIYCCVNYLVSLVVSTEWRWPLCVWVGCSSKTGRSVAAELLILTYLSAKLIAECSVSSCPGGAFSWQYFLLWWGVVPHASGEWGSPEDVAGAALCLAEQRRCVQLS